MRFGAQSYQPDGRDCPVGGDWDTWCNCMFTEGTAENTQCKWKVSISCPQCAFAPWTDIGAGARGIRKRDSGVGYTVGQITAPPRLDEYEPDVLFRTSVYNWPRFVFLMSVAGSVLSLGNPIVGLATAATLGPNPAAAVTVWTTLPMLAFPAALAAGGWTRVEQNVLTPLADLAGDAAKIAIGGVTGTWQVETVAFFARRAAKNVQGSSQEEQILKAAILAIAENAADVLIIAKDPVGQLSQSGRWVVLGDGIQRIASSFPNSDAKSATLLIGDALKTFSWSLAQLVRGDIPEAINQSTVGIVGSDMRTLAAMGDEFSAKLALLKGATNRTKQLDKAIGFFELAFDRVRAQMSGAPVFDQLIQWLDKAWRDFAQVWSQVQPFIDKSLAAGKPTGAPAAVAPRKPGQFVVMNVKTTGLQPQARSAMSSARDQAPPSSSWLPVLLAVGLGAAVGGPPGALMGGGAALLLAKKG